jgi:hypothetical protein
VVKLSADSSRINVEFTMQQGAKGFLTKPFAKGSAPLPLETWTIHRW